MRERNVVSTVTISACLCILGFWSGCQTGTSKPLVPPSLGESMTALSLQELRVLEEDIVTLLVNVRHLEQERAEFAQYFNTAKNDRTWSQILVALPGYNEATFFPFTDYLAERKKVQADLERRVELLDKQIQVLREYVTAPDGYMLHKGR